MEPVTCREMLDVIDEFLSKRDAEASKLWDVLTALRGPDTSDYDKTETTVHIRSAAFPKTEKSSNPPVDMPGYTSQLNGALFASSPMLYNKTPFSISLTYSHFMNHIRNAALALGMMKG